MPIEAKNTKLTKRLSEKLKVKHNTGRVYASLIKQMWLRTSKEATHDNLPDDLGFLKSSKTKAYVKGIVNLTRRKNHANAAVAGLKLVDDEKSRGEYRDIMMTADKDYQKFLGSGKRQRNFKNAEASWKLIINAHKKVARVLNIEGIWREGEHVNHTQYKKLMAWLYFKWLADTSPRRLEYVDTRFVSGAAYRQMSDASKDGFNWVVEDKKWTWEVRKYKTRRTYGAVSFPIGRSLKAALRKVKPIAAAKNNDGFIFLNSKWKPLGRNAFSTMVKSWFKTYLGKAWTQNTVRSIRVSAMYRDAPKSVEIFKLAKDMGHDVETQLLHYRQEENGHTK